MQVFWQDITSCWQKKILQKYWEGHMPVAMFYSTVITFFFFPCETYKSLSSSETNHTHEKQQKNKTKQDDGDFQIIS